MEYWRHGDLLIEKTSEIPKGLKQKENNILLEGETTGHMHTLNRAEIFLAPLPPSKDTDYLAGYFSTKEGALLTHQEHETIEIPAGTYKFYHQREYDEQEERVVID